MLTFEVRQHRVVELPGLDSEALRTELARSDVRCVRAPYHAALLDHPRVARLASFAPDFSFSYEGNLFTLPIPLGRTLRRGGLRSCRAREALVSEVQYLALVLAGLVDDFAPLFHLAMVDRGGPVPEPPWRDSARAALLWAFEVPDAREGEDRPGRQAGPLPDAEREVVELSPDTAFVVKLDPAAGMQFHAASGSGRLLLLWVGTQREPDWKAWGGGAWPRLSSPEPVDVLLISMPFGPALQPSLGLSLLKNTLPAGTAKILYLSLVLARRIGRPLYQWISDRIPFATTLAGEWLFRKALFPEVPEDPRRYLDEVLLRSTSLWHTDYGESASNVFLVSDGLVADLLQVRDLLDGFLDHCVEEVLAHRPKVVALTSVFEQHAASLALARRLKERSPETRVVLGGANCEGVMGLALLRICDFVDAVVSGEGEAVLPQIVERWLAGRPLDGLQGVYTHASPEVVERMAEPRNAPSPIPLDDLPYPDFDDFFDQVRAAGFVEGRESRLLFESSRGCWWGEKKHCTFCSLNGVNMAFRSKSADRALAELRWMTERYPGRAVSTVDNILDMEYFKTFLPSLAQGSLAVNIFYEVKSNLRKDQIRLLRAAGVGALQAGVESFSDPILQHMGKGVKGLQNIRLLKWCQELELWPYWNLLWGFPGETPADYESMAEMVPWLHHLPPPTAISPIFLERFSPNFFRSAELGFARLRPMSAYPHVYPVAGEELQNLAFFFDYEYQDGRDAAGYVRPLIQRIADWRDVYTECTLAAIDLGDRLVICDTRPAAVESLTFLDGLARNLYLACDDITSVGQLCRSVGPALSRGEVEDALQPLVDKGLLLRQGDALLALAIARQSDDSPKQTDIQP